ncbi:MAG: hypothetical protein JXX29_22000 [Deltaproteobacteria bacterium]|nr:hypothetical protein [Deltaproteobacteria bacterium]MBN2674369.1 hypothetical protein [Deltaproteobacteria bacterium]
MNICRILLLVVLLGGIPHITWARERSTNPNPSPALTGPKQPHVSYHSNTLVGKDEAFIRRNNRMQKAGHILLIVGSHLCLAGVIVMESMGTYAYGPLGTIALVGAGTGIASLLTGFVLLGFSRPYHGPPLPHAGAPDFTRAKTARLSFVKTF